MTITEPVADHQEPGADQMALPMLVTDGQAASQYRISTIQILNWGAYSGLETMQVSRSGVAIVGPSGRGKSTLLDALASVILPNPQEFNQAARDDRGRKRERTVYSYARGHTDQRHDGQRATTNYLRPPGSPAFPTGAAITWRTQNGRTVTCFQLAWIGSDTDGPDAVGSATVYGFVHEKFDLANLAGLKPVRAGGSPLSKASLERLVDTERGDLVDTSQAKVHAKMRAVMGMGATDESQRLAMHLLRRAQASKGIFSINALFKEFVLTEPLALTRWDIALEAYREASRLYQEFETARRRIDTLAPLAGIAARYEAAGADYLAKQALLTGDADHPARITVWHADKVVDWGYTAISDNQQALGEVDEQLTEAITAARTAERAEQDTIAALTAAGGDRSEAIGVRLDHARETLRAIETVRDELAHRLAPYELYLPEFVGELTETRSALADLAKEEDQALAGATAAAGQAESKLWRTRDRLKAKRSEIDGLRTRRTMIPEDADTRRNRIAQALDLDPDQLRYAGELLQLRPQERRWEKAVLGVVIPLASTLLVDSRDFPAVRRYVHDHDMHGTLTIAPAIADRPLDVPPPGSIPSLLEIADHPYAGWLSHELLQSVGYACVESADELDRPQPGWARGAITPAGMRTGTRNRFVKDDRRQRYPWIGWDNRTLLADLEDELDSLAREAQAAEQLTQELTGRREQARNNLVELRALHAELLWDRIDITDAQARVDELTEQLDSANSPEVTGLTEQLSRQRAETVAAGLAVERLRSRYTQLHTESAELAEIFERAKATVDAQPPLTQEELGALAGLPFAEPTGSKDVAAGLVAAVAALREQVDRHAQDRERAEEAVIGRLAAYRNLDERTARETDGTIESLPAVLAIYQQLVTDDLPRIKHEWLAKVDDDMNRQLRELLVQIEDDARSITRGLDPINTVLQHVRFRQSSTLSIEPVEQIPGDLKDFRTIVTRYTRHRAGLDPERDAEQIERSFVTLHKHLRRLDEQSRAGDAWRRRVFDAREHVEFRAVETRADGVKMVHDGVAGMSGGEGQELIAFILGAALRFRLGDGQDGPPGYASLILDEGFVKADSDYTGRALSALKALGFQLIVGAPREKATAFEGYVESVAYINTDSANPKRVRIYGMTMAQALEFEGTDR